MRAYIKILLLIVLALLFTQCEKAEQDLYLNEPYFTIVDQAFLNALIDVGVDTNGDNLISYAEAEAVTILDVSNDSIFDMTGIERFVNLYVLDCSHNNLNNLYISGCIALRELLCVDNKLTSLDVSKNPALISLMVDGNQLDNLDVSENIALKLLGCGENLLTSLDVTKNSALTELYCSYNLLTSLDVSNNTSLYALSCGPNQLASIDLSTNTALTKFWCPNNQLTSLDVSANIVLEELYITYAPELMIGSYEYKGQNNLTNLDITNNSALDRLYIAFMPNLYEVCVWEGFSMESVNVTMHESPNVYFTTNCGQ